jgi:UDP-glucuronate 4-epimerase
MMASRTAPILVTGAAGFIGYHVARRLLERGEAVIGIDNLNDYYDVRLKKARLAQLKPLKTFRFQKLDLVNRKGMAAGVRYSLVNPHAYTDSNIVGFMNVLEGCRRANAEHLVYASSSSVYGGNTRMPFSVRDNVDHPVSLYAATKKANELMAHTYAHLYGVPCTGLRFFTVYGPWGRPDMALFLFTKAILSGKPIDVFNHGRMKRDFTYIDDVVEGVVRTLDRPARPDPAWSGEAPNSATSSAPYRLYNIGNHQPVELLRFIEILERALGKTAKKNFLPIQAGDVPATYADVQDLIDDVGFKPDTPLEEGIRKFVEWYRSYYGC